MKTSLGLAAIALGVALAAPSEAHAQRIGRGRNFGLGVVAGYPNFGLSLNYFFNEGLSLQIDPQIYAWQDTLWVGGRVDLLFYPGRPLMSKDAFDLRWYIGPGLGIGVGLGNGAGLALVPEVPIGIGFQFSKVPIDLMLEAVPQFWIYTYDRGGAAGFNIWVSGALHVRYYF
ncbi:MAG: hypothetical protein U0325_02545 [Polyangiales bacterium]